MDNMVCQLLVLFGIPTIISSISGAIWMLISKRLYFKWNRKENEKLENLKGEIAKSNQSLSNLLSSQTETYLVAQEKRLMAIETYWKSYLKTKALFPSGVYLLYNILNVEEIEKILTNDNSVIKEDLRKLNVDNYLSQLIVESKELESERIYLEPQLWTYFFIYRAFCGRLVNYVGKGIQKGKITHWTQEKEIKDLLLVIFDSSEISNVYCENVVNSLQYAFDLIEFKILNEITELTTGKKQTHLGVQQIRDFNELFIKK